MSDAIVDSIWGFNAIHDLNKILGELDSYIEHYAEKNLISSDVIRLLTQADNKARDAIRILIKQKL